MRIRLSDEEKDIFSNGMEELRQIGNGRDPFVKMAEILPQFNARQLCYYWRNYLDPELCHHELDEEEKQLIDNWISLNKSENEMIEWNNLRQYLKNQFGYLRSENMLRKYCYN
ncbi:hypothetical protein GLOIN_2v1662697 [Rhizophagus clarus]|uniref:HTH myb-type domain-containing protein n=1 Tax=Rhizophagus clarus TaxID=94130 RepID=A0A8H3MFP6_9GLOM|nr:hypothetical protein GLOIN_2v1662697 [Rhizophagus clarus]